MKKILIPMVAVAFLAACSDEDTNFAAPPSANATVSSSSEAQLPPTDLSSSSVLPVGDLSSSSVVLPELSSSSVEALPGVSSSSVDALPGVSSSSNGASQFTYVVPKLTALDPTKKYSFYGAELTGLDQFKYGRFEARMKMAALSGTVSSMFVYYDNSWLKESRGTKLILKFWARLLTSGSPISSLVKPIPRSRLRPLLKASRFMNLASMLRRTSTFTQSFGLRNTFPGKSTA